MDSISSQWGDRSRASQVVKWSNRKPGEEPRPNYIQRVYAFENTICLARVDATEKVKKKELGCSWLCIKELFLYCVWSRWKSGWEDTQRHECQLATNYDIQQEKSKMHM